MMHTEALAEANRMVTALAPYVERIAIAGSIRRMKQEVKDIELVCIPKMGGGMFGEQFADGFTVAVYKLLTVRKGSPYNGKYIHGTTPEGVKVDLFTTTADNWGWIFCLRTGSAEHNIKLVQRLKSNGYKCADGRVHFRGEALALPEEADVFKRAGLPYTGAQFRTA